MRILTALLLVSMFISGCSQANENVNKTEIKKEKKNVTQDEKIIRSILSPLKVQGVEVKKVEPAEVKVPGFKVYEVTIDDKRNHREIKKYVFLSKKGNYLALEMFKYKIKGDKVLLKPINPKNPVKELKTDVSFVRKVDEMLTKANIPHVIGKSNRKVYIVWDVFCPFCSAHFNQLEEIARKNNVEIHMIPLAVHGENSIKGLIYYTQIARERGAAEAFKELYSLGNGDFMKYAKNLEEKIKKGGIKLSKEEQNKIKETLKNVEKELLKNGVRATPTIIYAPPGEKKGYIHVGFKPIEEVLKEK
ncbi:thiol:disulfide interchange protein DsbC [Balnearium lithotrophicum]|uniref:Thiol:disulfide interchange protein DsbC n=1 Tax=Balnearium lithotrophicum TaxID=223788 RepID=A0A521B8F7_9BACT|nr:thioredoxin domain-containing protein [Balnearium lithotrophicum]SMO42990.1 thiol:disulfide interchange protein DsbC [Balnearium lithotrophicum]